MRKAVPVIIFTIFLAGCHAGGSAPVTVTKTVTVPASKPAAQRPSKPTTTSAMAPAAGAAAQQTIVQQAPQPIYEPAPVPTIYNPEPDSLEPDVPLGFTAAPTGAPQPLWDKSISYCMDDPVYERGTTMFTDGTTGWTSECAG